MGRPWNPRWQDGREHRLRLAVVVYFTSRAWCLSSLLLHVLVFEWNAAEFVVVYSGKKDSPREPATSCCVTPVTGARSWVPPQCKFIVISVGTQCLWLSEVATEHHTYSHIHFLSLVVFALSWSCPHVRYLMCVCVILIPIEDRTKEIKV